MRIITEEEFFELNKQQDLCFLVCEGKVSDDPEDYFGEQEETITNKQSLEDALLRAKSIPVYKKDRFVLHENHIIEYLQDYLTDNYAFDVDEHGHLDDYVRTSVFSEFVQKFNKQFNWYTSGEQLYTLDLSTPLDNYLKHYLQEDYPC